MSEGLSIDIQGNNTDLINPLDKLKAVTEKDNELLDQWLQESHISPMVEIPPPEIAFEQVNEDHKAILGTLGNISLLIGKAKSKKSFLITLIASSILKNNKNNPIQSRLPDNQKVILHFDTEQGDRHNYLACQRICKALEDDNPTYYQLHALRKFTPAERLKIIERAVYKHDDIGILIIDGIKDLITSINDEEQATNISSKLMKWSAERNIHIICVLHQNKGDNNARGHLGTELVNKAETVLSVTKNKDNPDISIVEGEYCRNREPEPFAFEIDDNGLPQFVNDFYIPEPGSNKKSFSIYDIPDDRLYAIINDAFTDTKEHGYTSLWRTIKIAFNNSFGESIGDNKAKDFLAIGKSKGMIVKSETRKRNPYELGEFQP